MKSVLIFKKKILGTDCGYAVNKWIWKKKSFSVMLY